MFLTRTIRRKMVFGLVLVLVMLVVLSLSSISGLISYRNAVRELDASINQTPRVSDLFASLGSLFEPLVLESATLEAARLRQAEFETQLALTRGQVNEFRRRLEQHSPATSLLSQRRPMINAMLHDIDDTLDRLDRRQSAAREMGLPPDTAERMRLELGALLNRVRKMPDSEGDQTAILNQARREYRSHFWLVCGTSTIACVLFVGLMSYGYSGIFSPINKLHQGASRVALGDFDYRVELTTRDEMAELADSFNKMTDRFREVACDLDQQVRERSKQLVRSERLAGVGFLAAGVAHEINNPLQAIMMASGALMSRADEFLEHASEADAADVRRYLSMIERESCRCKQITAKLLDFSRGQDATRGRNDLAAIVSEVLSMIRHMSKYRDRTIQFEPNSPCYLDVNGPEIKQAVLNMVANALEAMESGGTLQIDIDDQTDHVIVTFNDDGCGMTPETIDNLFEPFFTRRKDGKGTGLGMSISHRIITDHGGTIEAFSDGPGHGSTFRIHLPRKAPRQEAAA